MEEASWPDEELAATHEEGLEAPYLARPVEEQYGARSSTNKREALSPLPAPIANPTAALEAADRGLQPSIKRSLGLPRRDFYSKGL